MRRRQDSERIEAKLKKRRIKISEAREERELREMLEEIHADLGERLSEEDVVRAVRATREMRRWNGFLTRAPSST
jgi:hypothetical protein